MLEYRPDIDGLRALAVLAVLLFHAFPAWFPGGFIGVDVFFVISGYLIGNIVSRDLTAARFRFAHFYARRALRILPALTVVMLTVAVISWYGMFPGEYKLLGSHMVAASLFAENGLLAQEAGYFAQASNTKPLMHLWSLSIEEQFYLAFPLLLIGLKRLRGTVLWPLAGIALLSLLSCAVLSHYDAEHAFFNPLARAWEILFGAVLAELGNWPARPAGTAPASAYPGGQAAGAVPQLRDSRAGSAMAAIGLLLFVGGVFGFHPRLQYPGLWAMLPVLAALLIIAAGATATLNRRLLAHPWLRIGGRISYPLYLWHWPLLSLLTLLAADHDSPWLRLLVLAASVALALLTYHGIERPLQRQRQSRLPLLAVVMSALLVTTAGADIYLRDGLSFRLKDARAARYTFGMASFPDSALRNAACESRLGPAVQHAQFCMLSKAAEPTVMLIGDSTAWELYSGLAQEPLLSTETFLSLNHGLCVPFLGYGLGSRSTLGTCEAIGSLALRIALQTPSIRTVILAANPRIPDDATMLDFGYTPTPASAAATPASRGAAAQLALRGFAEALLSSGRRLVVVVGNPQFPFRLAECVASHLPMRFDSRGAESCALSRQDFDHQREPYLALLHAALNGLAGARIVDTAATLCTADACPVARGKDLLYVDDLHLSTTGSALVARQLQHELSSAAAAPAGSAVSDPASASVASK